MMKKLFMIAAIALLGGMLVGCSSDDDKIRELENGPFEGIIYSSGGKAILRTITKRKTGVISKI